MLVSVCHKKATHLWFTVHVLNCGRCNLSTFKSIFYVCKMCAKNVCNAKKSTSGVPTGPNRTQKLSNVFHVHWYCKKNPLYLIYFRGPCSTSRRHLILFIVKFLFIILKMISASEGRPLPGCRPTCQTEVSLLQLTTRLPSLYIASARGKKLISFIVGDLYF